MRTRFTLFIAFLAVVSAVPFNSYEDEDPAIARTTSGKVKGLKYKNHLEWRGIRYAASTEGKNRWREPQPFDSWDGIQSATEFPNACPQPCVFGQGNPYCARNTSEDCLFLNVFAPNRVEGKRYPVLFYIFGGSFEVGEGASGLYVDGARHIAGTTKTVVVLINYRLGPLGFLVAGKNITGNYGIQDQIAALQWVNENIVNFGGDPRRVTISGQSAGSISVGILLGVAEVREYFHQAIMQSNPLTESFKTVSNAQNWGAVFCTLLNCSIGDENCLRSKSSMEITKMTKQIPPFFSKFSINGSSIGIPWQPVIDEIYLRNQTITSALKGELSRVPVLIGTDADEGRLFIYNFMQNGTMKNYVFTSVITTLFGKLAPKVLDKYHPPASPSADCRDLMSLLATDYFFVCPTRKLSTALSQYENTFVYNFDHVTQVPGTFWGHAKQCNKFVCHGAEIPYLFSRVKTFTANETMLADTMVSYWTNFVHTGNPNFQVPQKNAPTWPVYNPTAKSIIKLATPISVQSDYKGSICDFWDTIGYNL